MIRRIVLVTLVCCAAALPLRADFKAVARALDAHPGVSRVSVPFMGLARVIVRIASPEGVHDFQLATFEGGARLQGAELRKLMERNAGKGFTPLVQTWSRRTGEWSFIYAKPSASGRTELMLLAHDADDTTLIRVEVNADVIARHIEHEPDSIRNVARR